MFFVHELGIAVGRQGSTGSCQRPTNFLCITVLVTVYICAQGRLFFVIVVPFYRDSTTTA
jgi:hypothetical protein